MAIPIPVVLISLTNKISKIHSKDDFESNLNDFGFHKIKLLKKDNFFDFPQGNLLAKKGEKLSHTYLYEITPNDKLFYPLFKIMYIDTICGGFILMDVFNKKILVQLQEQIVNSGRYVFNPKSQSFKEIISSNYILFTFYESIQLSAALIASDESFFTHPFYSYNKVIDFFN